MVGDKNRWNFTANYLSSTEDCSTVKTTIYQTQTAALMPEEDGAC